MNGSALFFILGAALYGSSCKQPGPQAVTPREDIVVSSGTIGVGGSLSNTLGKAQIPPQEASRVERALKPLFNPRYSKAKDRYETHRSTSGHIVRLIYWSNAFEYFTVSRSSSGVYAASGAKVPFEARLSGARGSIKVSLWEAMTAQGVPPEMIYRFADIFGWRIDFLTEPRVGDTYKIVWQREVSPTAVRDGEILCATYQGRETGTVHAYRLSGEYYDEKGNSLRGEFLRAPLAYRRISSRFTNARYHPILRYWRPHHGIDYSAARGTPVVSIGDGVVISKGYERGLGNHLRVRHSGSFVSIYGHLMGYTSGIRHGSSVKQGQLIGYVGSTGLSTGPHLHFGMERAGQLINFLAMKSTLMQKRVPAAEKARFKQILSESQNYFLQLKDSGAPVKDL